MSDETSPDPSVSSDRDEGDSREEDTSVDELNPEGAGAGASEESSFEPEEDNP